MQEVKYLTIHSKKKKIALNINTILYVVMEKNDANIHISGGDVYKTRMTLSELEKKLGDGFIKIRRGCLVAINVIDKISDTVSLKNGEQLKIAAKRKDLIIDKLTSVK